MAAISQRTSSRRASRERLTVALIALAFSAGAGVAALGCRPIEDLAEGPAAASDPSAAAAAAPAPPPAGAASGGRLGATPLLGPVFPGLAGVHTTSCDPTTDTYGTCL